MKLKGRYELQICRHFFGDKEVSTRKKYQSSLMGYVATISGEFSDLCMFGTKGSTNDLWVSETSCFHLVWLKFSKA